MKMQTERYNIISSHPKMKEVFQLVDKVAPTDSTVIVYGESGTGKELIAQALHLNGKKSNKPFIIVNCGAIPEELLESELFGHEKGSFTGAIRTRIGRFELACGGTIFLDEIGDMSPVLQVKILRVLQNKTFERVGGTETINADVRVIAATNKNLEEAIKEGKFREDLYYRLNVIPIHLPALRERKTDIPELVSYFVKHFNDTMQKQITEVRDDVLKYFLNYDWPGNIRELENLMERLMILNTKETISLDSLPERILGKPADQINIDQKELFNDDDVVVVESMALRDAFKPKFFIGITDDGVNLKQMVEDFEKELILEALDKTGWVKNKAAGLLGLNRTTLVEKIKKLQLVREVV